MKKNTPKATKTVYPTICQIVNTIPTQFVAETAKAHKVLSRTFSPKSPVAAMLYCQVSKTESLNSICDVARANDALWRSMDVTPPMRNTLSNANAHGPSDRTKDLYWKTFNYLVGIAPKFGKGPHRGYCFRIKAPACMGQQDPWKLRRPGRNAFIFRPSWNSAPAQWGDSGFRYNGNML